MEAELCDDRMAGESGCGDRIAELVLKLTRSEKEYMEFPGQRYTLIMELSSNESQKLCGNLKESGETLQECGTFSRAVKPPRMVFGDVGLVFVD